MSPATALQAAPAEPLDAAQAGASLGELAGLIETLIGLTDRETDLLKAGYLARAAEAAQAKQAATDAYIALASRLGPHAAKSAALAAEAAERVRQLQDTLHDRLTYNLAVISTARDVSENLVRSAARTVALRSRPTVYAFSGANPHPPQPARGIVIDRAT